MLTSLRSHASGTKSSMLQKIEFKKRGEQNLLSVPLTAVNLIAHLTSNAIVQLSQSHNNSTTLLSFAMAAMNYCSRSGGMGKGGRQSLENNIWSRVFNFVNLFPPEFMNLFHFNVPEFMKLFHFNVPELYQQCKLFIACIM